MKILYVYVQVTKYLEYIGKFSTCLRTQAGRLFWVWGALLCFNIHKSYKKFVKSTFVVCVPFKGGMCFVVQKMPKNASKNSPVLYHGQRKGFCLGFAIFHTPSHTKGVWKIEKPKKKTFLCPW